MYVSTFNTLIRSTFKISKQRKNYANRLKIFTSTWGSWKPAENEKGEGDKSHYERWKTHAESNKCGRVAFENGRPRLEGNTRQFVYVSAVTCQQRWEPCQNAEEMSRGEEQYEVKLGTGPQVECVRVCVWRHVKEEGYRRRGRWRSTRRGGWRDWGSHWCPRRWPRRTSRCRCRTRRSGMALVSTHPGPQTPGRPRCSFYSGLQRAADELGWVGGTLSEIRVGAPNRAPSVQLEFKNWIQRGFNVWRFWTAPVETQTHSSTIKLIVK